MRKALVTGAAGFIGSHLVERLLGEGWTVVGIDNFDPYYDPQQKRRNLASVGESDRFTLVEGDIRDEGPLGIVDDSFDVVIHLAAKAGVRPSIADPAAYYDVNVTGTLNVLEAAKRAGVRQFVFASSSSVYGNSPEVPWKEDTQVLRPISPYASTKVSCELLGHVYSHLYGIRFVGLRIFTVYGPRQRPDLAIHKFARLILAGEPVPLFGDGSTRRDYTFVSDIVAGIVAAVTYEGSLYEIVNLGSGRPVTLLEMVEGLEAAVGARAERRFGGLQPGDVTQTYADLRKASRVLGYSPAVRFRDGLASFVEWLRTEPVGRAD